MKKNLIFCMCLIVIFAAFTTSADAADIRISAAASLTEAIKEVIAVYRQNYPEDNPLPNFASSGALAKQMVAGAPADIYISANPKWMDYLQQQLLIVPEARRALVQNRLVVVGNGGSIDSLQRLTELSRVAICSPKTSPAGKYAEQSLSAAGVYPQLLAEQKLISAKDVRQALLYADRGEVDAAFVYRTDALLASQAEILFTVPQELYPQVIYPAALTPAGSKKSSAKTFFSYLFGTEAQQTFRKYGFLVP